MKYGFLFLSFAVALSLAAVTSASAGQPDDLCRDVTLTRQEQDLCAEQIKKAQSLTEQKAIQAKYRKRIAERAKK
jgi:hypothetical protein